MSKTEPVPIGADGWSIYRRLNTYTLRYWGAFALGVVGFIVYAQTQWMLADLMDYIVTSLQTGNLKAKTLIPLAIMGIFVIRGVGLFLGNYGISYVGRRIVYDIRSEMFDRLLLVPKQYYHEHLSGHLISKITFDVEQVSGAATNALKIIIREGLTVIALLGYLFYQNWQLSLVFLTIAPVIAIVVRYASQRFRRISKRIQGSMGSVTHVSSEAINGYEEVRMYAGESYECDRFRDSNGYNLRQSMKMVVTQAASTAVIQFIVAASLSALIWIALRPGLAGDITPGEFIAFITAAGLLPKPIRQLTAVNAALQRGISAARSVFSVIDAESEKDSGTKTIARAVGHISFDGVSFCYPGTSDYVLHDINFEAKPGQTIALVGRSGSGKSTLVSLIPRFFDVSEGEVSLDQVPLNEYVLKNLRNQIAIVSQKVMLFNGTIRENIAYGGLASSSDADIEKAAKAAHALEFIVQMEKGFDTEVGPDGIQLSGGQRQRIAIARALLKDAPVLILDEATSALDTESERKIQEALNELMRGRTTIVIAHRLSTIEKADMIMVMDKGRIVERGTHSGLLEKAGIYAGLQNNQSSEPPVNG